MADPSDLEARVSALETHVNALDNETRIAREDAAAARHLAAARDRDLADLTIKIDANRSAINALGVQTRGRFDEMDRRFDEMDRRFGEVDRRLDTAAVGQQQIVELLNTLIDRD
jgi:hypothetical protein